MGRELKEWAPIPHLSWHSHSWSTRAAMPRSGEGAAYAGSGGSRSDPVARPGHVTDSVKALLTTNARSGDQQKRLLVRGRWPRYAVSLHSRKIPAITTSRKAYVLCTKSRCHVIFLTTFGIGPPNHDDKSGWFSGDRLRSLDGDRCLLSINLPILGLISLRTAFFSWL